MKPIVSVEQMRVIDASSSVPEAELIRRAAWAVSRVAIEMLGGTYGRHVVAIAGPGNNGADARAACGFLHDRGVRISIFEPGSCGDVPPCDLVIDGAYGTGFHGEYKAPDVHGTPVLAIDIPSGVAGNTGVACVGAVRATRTVTFAAYKPGHFLADGPDFCSRVDLVDIGLDIGDSSMWLFESDDLSVAQPAFERDSHKWKAALGVVAGAPGMDGACQLAVMGAQRAGASMIRVLRPGLGADSVPVAEAVGLDGRADVWSATVIEASDRLHALVIGPGLGRDVQTQREVLRVLQAVDIPVLVDADGLFAVASDEGRAVLRNRKAPTLLTPHDGEFGRVMGERPGALRYGDVVRCAQDLRATVLLKGATTIVADASGAVRFNATGIPQLATAGTGDVLSGIAGAFLARGVDVLTAAAAAACVHGLAARNSYSHGLIATDLPQSVAALLSSRRPEVIE